MAKLTVKKMIGRSVLTFIILLTIFLVLNFKTNFFCLTNQKVTGIKVLTKEQILLASGVKSDDNIFITSSKTLAKNIEKHPYVKTAKVSKRLPNTIQIQVQEREEFVEIRQEDFFVYIDEDGRVLKAVTEKIERELPILEGLAVKKSTTGEVIEFQEKVEIQKIISLMTALKSKGLENQIKKIAFKANFNVEINLEHLKVAFGELDDIQYKVSFLDEILKKLEEKGLEKGVLHFDKGKNPVFLQEEM